MNETAEFVTTENKVTPPTPIRRSHKRKYKYWWEDCNKNAIRVNLQTNQAERFRFDRAYGDILVACASQHDAAFWQQTRHPSHTFELTFKQFKQYIYMGIIPTPSTASGTLQA